MPLVSILKGVQELGRNVVEIIQTLNDFLGRCDYSHQRTTPPPPTAATRTERHRLQPPVRILE
jgi:hypothetical protein